MMIPRQPPSARAPVAVFDKRKREGDGAKPTETVTRAAGGRDLPTGRRGAGVTAQRLAAGLAAGRGVRMQDETEPATGAGGECEPARRREIGFLARELGYDRAYGVALERFLHGPQGILRAQ